MIRCLQPIASSEDSSRGLMNAITRGETLMYGHYRIRHAVSVIAMGLCEGPHREHRAVVEADDLIQSVAPSAVMQSPTNNR